MITTSEPFSPSEMAFLLNSERYLLLTRAHTEGGNALTTRSWEDNPMPDQPADPKPIRIPLGTFHQGSGFSQANLPGVYAVAHQWDAASPGRCSTWARHAVGENFTDTGTNRGFLVSHGGYLYVFRGRHVKKYTPSTTPGSMWAISESKDHGAATYTPGAPAVFNDRVYVPRADASGLIVWQELTTVAAPPGTDTWTAGPAGKEARCFENWKELLARADGANGVGTCSATPTTAANWSDHGGSTYKAGDPGSVITELVGADQYLFAMKEDGLYSFDANIFSRNEMADARKVRDSQNGIGSVAWGGGSQCLVPHKQGLVRFRPGRWRFIGPEQEGALEGDLETGWGRPLAAIGYGPVAFAVYKDEQNSAGMLVSFQQPKGEGRGPYIPHTHYVVSSGWFEALEIHQDSASGNLYLVALFVDSATQTSVTPYIWRLPASGMSVANDPRVPKGVTSDAYLRTARFFQPSRAVQKVWRAVDLYAELTGGDADEGLQVWASVDGGAFFQLLDSSGTAATITTDGFTRVYFPKTTAAAGKVVQLEFRIESGGTSVALNALRDVELIGTYRPIVTRAIKAMIYLGGGMTEDGSVDQRTYFTEESALRALSGYGATPDKVYACHTPWNEDIYVTVATVSIKEITYRMDRDPIKVAEVVLLEEKYS